MVTNVFVAKTKNNFTLNEKVKMIVPIKKACRTTFISNAIDSDLADAIFAVLRDEIPWKDGVRSKNGFTRKAHPCNMGDYPQVWVNTLKLML